MKKIVLIFVFSMLLSNSIFANTDYKNYNNYLIKYPRILLLWYVSNDKEKRFYWDIGVRKIKVESYSDITNTIKPIFDTEYSFVFKYRF